MTVGGVVGLLSFAAPAAAQDPEAAASTLMTGLCPFASAPGVQGQLGTRGCFTDPLPGTDPAFRAIAWEDVATQGTFSVEASNQQFTALASRLRALRLGASGLDARGLALLDDRLRPAAGLLASTTSASAAQAPGATRRLGAFISGSLSFGDKDSSRREVGFDFDAVGITGGIDYRFTDDFIVGIALGYTSHDADLNGDAGEIEADTYTASLYATYYIGGFFLDFTAGGGKADYEMSRNIRYVVAGDAVDKTAISDTDGTHYTLSLGAGYEFRAGGAILSPYANVNYLRAEIDSFREQGADEFNLAIGRQKVESLLSILGGQVSYLFRGARGTLAPQLRAEWRHEFLNDPRSLSARFVNDPRPGVVTAVIRSEDPDRDYFNVAAGVVATLTDAASLAFEYETVLGLRDITNHILRARLRVAF